MSIAIAVNVHEESERQVTVAVKKMRQFFPSASLRLFCNGTLRTDLLGTAERLRLTVCHGENYGDNDHWHLWWTRMLLYFNETCADVCFKFDPDTAVDRHPYYIPEADYFGSIVNPSVRKTPFVQGGATGLSAKAVRLLLHSGLLETFSLRSWMGEVPPRLHLIDDQLLAEALLHLGIRPVRWSECCCDWKRPVANASRRFAIVHPRYYL